MNLLRNAEFRLTSMHWQDQRSQDIVIAVNIAASGRFRCLNRHSGQDVFFVDWNLLVGMSMKLKFSDENDIMCHRKMLFDLLFL